MLAGILGFIFVSLQVIGPAVSQEAPEYVGTFQGTKWYISGYKGGSPGPGILAFNVIESSPTGQHGPLFIKCNKKQYSEYFEAYRPITPNQSLVWELFRRYC